MRVCGGEPESDEGVAGTLAVEFLELLHGLRVTRQRERGSQEIPGVPDPRVTDHDRFQETHGIARPVGLSVVLSQRENSVERLSPGIDCLQLPDGLFDLALLGHDGGQT